MAKAKDAFRTISEVSELLDTPAHVLRFWESKFSQIKPVKRAGGRRYYRPDDLALLSGIKILLHEEGMTIKGAQKLLREKGVKHVVKLGEDAMPDASQTVDHAPASDEDTGAAPVLAMKTPALEEKVPETDTPAPPRLFTAPSANAPADTSAEDVPPGPASVPMTDAPEAPADDDVPSFMRKRPQAETPHTPAVSIIPPSVVDDAPDAAEEDIVATPAPIAAALDVPQLPDALPNTSGRMFDAIQRADVDVIARNTAQIAPLLDKLADLRDKLRAS